MTKKKYNPFKMWGSYLGAITFWWLWILTVIALSGLEAAISMSRTIGFMEAFKFTLGVSTTGLAITPLVITIGVLIVGFLVGWGLHAWAKKNKVVKIVVWIILIIIYLLPIISLIMSSLSDARNTGGLIIVIP